MIFGIGIDSSAIARFEKSLKRENFNSRVFSGEELEHFLTLGEGRMLESAAANFAAKEAFLKACGAGLGSFDLADISALRERGGRPYYKLTGAAGEFCAKNGLRAHLSITHESGVATAMCVLETT